jgi:hypothetical protein
MMQQSWCFKRSIEVEDAASELYNHVNVRMTKGIFSQRRWPSYHQSTNSKLKATTMSTDSNNPFSLRFSHNIIEHLGLKLYQNKPTNVIAELVSNSWDAMATCVDIDLFTTAQGSPEFIVISDNGSGMDEDTVKNKYLVIGKNKGVARSVSQGQRPPMGRKGIGKLAPFGVAKEIALLTIHDSKIIWINLNYESMLGLQSAAEDQLIEYKPEIKYLNVDVGSISFDGLDERISNHLEVFFKNNSGTMIICKDLTIRRPISPSDLKTSLGRRFTVTANRPDFKVSVNKECLTEQNCLPEWDLRIPETGTSIASIETPFGTRTVNFWVGFVGAANWSQEEAGVGVYAHGKIAQDRPFFFGAKGQEIFTRYMYAVVEADWIDELDHDAISTDRTSIDWTDQNFEKFYEWGAHNLKSWVRAYQTHRQQKDRVENNNLIEQVALKKNFSIRESEKKHLVDLVSEITPKIEKNSDNRERLIESTLKAWTHEPARRLIKKLWEQTSEFDTEAFPDLVYRLVEELVPESLSLGVIVAQRVYALTRLENHIMTGNETQLQKLLEEFPWIIGSDYEKFIARKSLINIIKEAIDNRSWVFRGSPDATPNDYKFPDFVFLSDTNESAFLVIELKGPAATAGWNEYNQLQSYVQYLQSRYPDESVKGLLIARSIDPSILKQMPEAIRFVSWQNIILDSRKKHMQLLAALLAGTEADAQDSRVQQICELGGDTVKEFLKMMSATSPELAHLVNKLG